MAKLEKIEFLELPELYIVGKTIDVNWCKIKMNNPIPAFWRQCLNDATFEQLEEHTDYIYSPAYVGFMTTETYTCGMLMKHGCQLPAFGYSKTRIPETTVAASWIRGTEDDAIMHAHELTEKALEEWGYRYSPVCRWAMELYFSPRFTEKAEDGTVILDYYIPVVK